MNKYFRLQLTIILIVFSLVISSIIALFDYGKLKESVRIGHETKIEMAEDGIINSLHTIDKAYNFFDYKIVDEMEENSNKLIDMYEVNPEFETWNFDALSKRFGMDIYIINLENIIEYSSLAEDIGLNFEVCCASLSKLLDERRMSNAFHHDGMDIQQSSGEIKKFSYMPTPDQKYIIELGVLLGDDEIFKQFNFMTTIEGLIEDYEAINTINVYNSSGFLLGYTVIDNVPKKIDDEMRTIFNDVVRSGEANEIVEESNQGLVTYRYIPYVADEKRGLSTNRVVEIVYNDAELEGMLEYYQNEFIIQLIVIILASVALSFIIARLVAKPIYLAFHDSLTGLKNRAAFEDEIKKRLMKKKNSVALMMIDLDNFKAVNDSLGHSEGDRILKYTGKTIQDIAGSSNIASRVGGDEFVVVFSDIQKEEIKEIAQLMVDKINDEFTLLRNGENIDVSISVGIAYAIEGDDVNKLYDRADSALYTSKENGKNRFTICGFDH